jgi:hypothetical protein
MFIRQLSEHVSLSPAYTNMVQDITKELFSNTNINYFVYLRGSADGSNYILMSDKGLTLDWFDNKIPLTVGYSDEYKSLQSFSFLWSEKLPSVFLSSVREKHNLYNGISIVRRYKDYFELFGYADSNASMDNTARYLSCYSDLENFSSYFVKVGRDLIARVLRSPLVLPPNLSIQNHQEICLGNRRDRFLMKGLLGETHLTSQEYFSLQLLLKGKSYKEIAQTLSVSNKTVEKYVSQFKAKTGYSPRDIGFLHETGGSIQFTTLIRLTSS